MTTAGATLSSQHQPRWRQSQGSRIVRQALAPHFLMSSCDSDLLPRSTTCSGSLTLLTRLPPSAVPSAPATLAGLLGTPSHPAPLPRAHPRTPQGPVPASLRPLQTTRLPHTFPNSGPRRVLPCYSGRPSSRPWAPTQFCDRGALAPHKAHL